MALDLRKTFMGLGEVEDPHKNLICCDARALFLTHYSDDRFLGPTQWDDKVSQHPDRATYNYLRIAANPVLMGFKVVIMTDRFPEAEGRLLQLAITERDPSYMLFDFSAIKKLDGQEALVVISDDHTTHKIKTNSLWTPHDEHIHKGLEMASLVAKGRPDYWKYDLPDSLFDRLDGPQG
jgi:hypothetical protein